MHGVRANIGLPGAARSTSNESNEVKRDGYVGVHPNVRGDIGTAEGYVGVLCRNA